MTCFDILAHGQIIPYYRVVALLRIVINDFMDTGLGQ